MLQQSNHLNDNQVNGYTYGNGVQDGINAASYFTVNGVGHTLHYNDTGAVEHYAIAGQTDKYISYNSEQQPMKIVVGSSINDPSPEVVEEFRYTPNGKILGKRTQWQENGSTKLEQILYFGNAEITFFSGGGDVKKVKVADDINYVLGASMHSIEFLHKDYQGSVEAVTHSVYSTLVDKQSFGIFGGRESSDWLSDIGIGHSEVSALINNSSTHINSYNGYTGHMQLDRSGLIHMQGRLYDPVLGRFLSPDPVVFNESMSQAWNRYSYVANNPTKYTDPSGYEPVQSTSCIYGQYSVCSIMLFEDMDAFTKYQAKLANRGARLTHMNVLGLNQRSEAYYTIRDDHQQQPGWSIRSADAQNGGARRLAARRAAAARGSTTMPELAEGRYLAVIDSISGELLIDVETGDLWIIDSANNRHLHFGFVGLGGGVTIGGSVSRQFGALSVSSTSNVEGFSFHLEIDGTVGVGGTGSFQLLNQSLDSPSAFGGIGVGLEVGISGVGSYTWFKKVYDANDSPLVLSP